MNAVFRSLRAVQGLFNTLVPFARPGTPLWQDLSHATALCLFLYYAPDVFSADRQRRLERTIQHTYRSLTLRLGQIRGRQEQQDGQTNPDLLLQDGDNPLRASVSSASSTTGDEDDVENEEDEIRRILQNLPTNHQEDTLDRLPLGFAGEFFPPDHMLGDDPNEHNRNGGNQAAPRPDGAVATAGSRTRIVGTKKAKSLARRENRRAYLEHLRATSEIQRAQEESAREALSGEREEAAKLREEARIEFDERAKAARKQKREQEERDRLDFEAVVDLARRAMDTDSGVGGEESEKLSDERSFGSGGHVRSISFSEIVKTVVPHRDEVWVERSIRRAGLVGPVSGPITDTTTSSTAPSTAAVVLIVNSGFLVRVDRSMMDEFYIRLQDQVRRNGLSGGEGSILVSELPAIFGR